MHRAIRLFSTCAIGLTLGCALANAQLFLTGHTTGSFDDLAEANTTVTNAPDGSWASFQTGIPVMGSTHSLIEFQNVDFADVGSGEAIQVGLFNITNGMTEIGSGAPIARFNVGLELTSPEAQTLAISTINFHIDHTPNLPGAIPDVFAVSFVQPPPVRIQDYVVQFHVTVDPLEFGIGENATTRKGDITATFTPIPEPGTYAMWAAGLLAGLVAYRRTRRSSRDQVVSA